MRVSCSGSNPNYRVKRLVKKEPFDQIDRLFSPFFRVLSFLPRLLSRRPSVNVVASPSRKYPANWLYWLFAAEGRIRDREREDVDILSSSWFNLRPSNCSFFPDDMFLSYFTQCSTSFAGNFASTEPCVKTLCPAEGWLSGGQTAIVLGDNFYNHMQVMFGTTTVYGECLTPNAIKVIVPPGAEAGTVDVTITYKNQIFKSGGGKYTYVQPCDMATPGPGEQEEMEVMFARLGTVFSKELPSKPTKARVLRRAVEYVNVTQLNAYTHAQAAMHMAATRHYYPIHNHSVPPHLANGIAAQQQQQQQQGYDIQNGGDDFNNSRNSPSRYSDPATPNGDNSHGNAQSNGYSTSPTPTTSAAPAMGKSIYYVPTKFSLPNFLSV